MIWSQHLSKTKFNQAIVSALSTAKNLLSKRHEYATVRRARNTWMPSW